MKLRLRRRRPIENAPLRGELLNLESLEARAKSLAGAFTLARSSRAERRHLLRRLDENLSVLRGAYQVLAEDVRRSSQRGVQWKHHSRNLASGPASGSTLATYRSRWAGARSSRVP